MVMSFVEEDTPPLEEDSASSTWRFVSLKKADGLGWSKATSLANIRTTDDMRGLSTRCCYTQQSNTDAMQHLQKIVREIAQTCINHLNCSSFFHHSPCQYIYMYLNLNHVSFIASSKILHTVFMDSCIQLTALLLYG